MQRDGTPVKPPTKLGSTFTYGAPEVIKAKVAYLMAIKGVRQDGLHKLLALTPSQTMLSYVLNGIKRSAALEARIATVLGVTREELYGAGPLNLWRAA